MTQFYLIEKQSAMWQAAKGLGIPRPEDLPRPAWAVEEYEALVRDGCVEFFFVVIRLW